MKVIPKKTFLLRQEELDGGRRKDVIAKKGVAIEVTDKEAARFFGYFQFTENEKKKVVTTAQANKYKRLV
jgi:hypothetical protein